MAIDSDDLKENEKKIWERLLHELRTYKIIPPNFFIFRDAIKNLPNKEVEMMNSKDELKRLNEVIWQLKEEIEHKHRCFKTANHKFCVAIWKIKKLQEENKKLKDENGKLKERNNYLEKKMVKNVDIDTAIGYAKMVKDNCELQKIRLTNCEAMRIIKISDIKGIEKDTKLSTSVIGYKCTNCYNIYEDKEEAEDCCPEDE